MNKSFVGLAVSGVHVGDVLNCHNLLYVKYFV